MREGESHQSQARMMSAFAERERGLAEPKPAHVSELAWENALAAREWAKSRGWKRKIGRGPEQYGVIQEGGRTA